jgi:hypothetical protein
MKAADQRRGAVCNVSLLCVEGFRVVVTRENGYLVAVLEEYRLLAMTAAATAAVGAAEDRQECH